MTLTPLLDDLDELGAAGERLLAACRAVVRQADAELRLLEDEAAAANGGLQERVAAFLALEPDASASAVCAAVGGRRQDVLRAVRIHRNRFPSLAGWSPDGTEAA